MPDSTEHVQARHVRRCVVAAAGNLQTLVTAALEAQAAGRGAAIRPFTLGVRIVTASGGYTVSNPDGTGTLTLPATAVPYDIAATNGMEDTVVGGGANLGVEVYFTGNPAVP
jgi:hypothetical protein